MARLMRRRLIGLASRAGETSLAILGVRPAAALLVLGHMRSGSTLLLHLLLTHPRIAAMGERNATYTTEQDLARLHIAIRLASRKPFAPLSYVADQVNHNQFTPNPVVLTHPRVRVIFLLREPRATLSSLLELSRRYYRQTWSVSRAVDYYVARLETLAAIAARLHPRQQAAFVTYEGLVETPATTLLRLQRFLDLQTGFSLDYELQPFTGTRGDPGPNISRGRIVSTSSADGLDLSEADRSRTGQAYRHCCEALARFASAPAM